MTAAPLPLRLFLVDEDPVFRMGLRIWLEQRPEFAIAGEASTPSEALTQVAALRTAATQAATDAGAGAAAADADAPDADRASPTTGVDLVIVDLGLGEGDPDGLPGLTLCADLKQQYPDLPVVILSAQVAPVLEAAARAMGADGFGQRGAPVRELVQLIQNTAMQPPATAARADAPPAIAPTGWHPLRNLRQSSLDQITEALEALAPEIQQATGLYGMVARGRQRELRAAHWLVQRLLPASAPAPRSSAAAPGLPGPSSLTEANPPRAHSPGALQARPQAISPVADVRTRVCEAVFRKLQYSLHNRGEFPLEIDILREEKRRELLYGLLRAFEDLLDDLVQAQVPPGQIPDKVSDFTRDLWRAGLSSFFGRYFTPIDSALEQPLVEVLGQDEGVVQGEILATLPQTADLLSHLLFETPLPVDGVPHVATTPEALRRSQLLLENLLLQVACGVIQPLLNRFADVESFKRNLYQRRLLSSREIARFRNDLSWRYRWQRWVLEPKAIFESQQQLLALSPQGIQPQTIYAPRQAELETLSGVQYALTLALEARDAIAPRVRATVALVGSGLVYVLTEVVGRGIGLVGRGILKGVGSAWQDSRLRSRSRDKA
jgi:DNA-binding NarL/FixJ family response regulator